MSPAIALADEIKRRVPEAQILFVGSRRGIEASVVPQAGYPIRTIQVIGFRRSLSLEIFKFPLILASALVQAARVIALFRPGLVIGTGGYVSGPIGFMASLYGVRLVIQEQNSYPGITTRLLAPRASQVFLTYPESIRHFRNKQKLYVCGNPTRGTIGAIDRETAIATWGLDQAKRTVMVTGGSQGAHRINEAVLEALPYLAPYLARFETLQILWQTGPRDYETIRQKVSGHKLAIRVLDFIDDMASAYAAADLLVSRAGANTLAELTICGLPAILIPLPTAAAQHQEKNARVLADSGAAHLLLERTLTGEILAQHIIQLLEHPETLAEMGQKSLALGKPDAAGSIIDALFSADSSQGSKGPKSHDFLV